MFNDGKHWVNVAIEVDWQQGGKSIVREAYATTSDEPLFSAAEDLRRWADYLDDLSQRGIRTPDDEITAVVLASKP